MFRWLKLMFFNPKTLQELIQECRTPKDITTWTDNHIWYNTDMKNHNVKEYWQTAEETFKSRTGDCEDFAVLQYMVLKQCGYDPHIFAVFSKSRGGHGVCGVFDNSNDKWVHLSNWGYKTTKAKTLAEVPTYVYDDWTHWMECNPTGKPIRFDGIKFIHYRT